MTSRQRVLKALNHEEPDRVPIHDAPWSTTLDRWRNEGMPADVDTCEYFGFEFRAFGSDFSLQLPKEILEETHTYRIFKNANGAIRKQWNHATSTPELIGFTITSRDLWDRHKERLAWNDSRIDTGEALEKNRRETDNGTFITFNAAVGYDLVQGVVGTETLLMALVEQPDWCHEMFDAFADLIIQNAQAMIDAGYHFDGAFLYDDNGYRNGLLFSNNAYKATLFDVHKKLCDFFHSKNMPVLLHSCGDVTNRVELFIEAGFDCLQPLEVKAGMDLIALKKQYGDRLAFMGGIDARSMSKADPGVIENEIRTKFEAVKPGGGYIYHSDHSIPDDVSFEQYKHVLDLVRKYGQY